MKSRIITAIVVIAILAFSHWGTARISYFLGYMHGQASVNIEATNE